MPIGPLADANVVHISKRDKETKWQEETYFIIKRCETFYLMTLIFSARGHGCGIKHVFARGRVLEVSSERRISEGASLGSSGIRDSTAVEHCSDACCCS